MKTTGIPQVATLLAGLALTLGACVHDTDGEVASAEPLGQATEAVGDDARRGPGARHEGRMHGMKRHFEEADQNDDGQVTSQELQTAITAKFAAIDANSDGQLTEDELSAMRSKRQSEMKGKRIAKLDKNDNGAIDRDEAPPRMARHFDEVDADGDGKLTQAELGEGWKKHRRGKDGRGKKGHAHFDENGDGVVNAEEFSQRAFGWFERADADGDGTVSLAEIEAQSKAKRGKRGRGGKGKSGRMMKHLLEADANDDGQITKAEAEAFKSAKFDEIDKNGDGVLSDDERPGRKGGDKAGRKGRMHKADADGDGQVTKAEFIAGTSRWFERLDADGDEVITKAELENAKARMGKDRGMRGKRGPEGNRR